MPTPEIQFFRYDIPLRSPLTMSGGLSMHRRKGFLVCYRLGDQEGWGDIAPLDGYSRESYAEVEREIREGDQLSLPSIRCGLDWAVSSLRTGEPAPVKPVEIARLLPHDQTVIEAEPGSTVKIKVGRTDLRQDIDRVNKLIADHPQVIFRLDANRAWTLEQALAFSRAIDVSRVEFIEEPLREFADYDRYDRETAAGFALDESLVHNAPWPWKNLRALVIKPSLLGALSVVDELIQWAAYHDRYAVISSMYESGVGMRRLAELAAERTPDVPAGLDTYSWLADDVTTPRLAMQESMMSDGAPWQIDRSKLELVA